MRSVVVTSVGLGSLKWFLQKENGQVDALKKAQVSSILITLNMYIPFYFFKFHCLPQSETKTFLMLPT